MKTANVAELKNRLSYYLREVKLGREVLVSERNVPIAKLVPLRGSEDIDAEEMDLVARGLMRMPEDDSPLPDDFWKNKDLPNVPLETILRIIREDRDAR